MKAIETTGVIDEKHRLKLDQPLPIQGPREYGHGAPCPFLSSSQP